MTLNTSLTELKDLNCCVVIPTYNNCKTLQKVIEGVLVHTRDIIVVNDGSTDSTDQILASYSSIEQIHLSHNKGKGNAIRLGFAKAKSMGFQYVITIDSDGQHFPEDLTRFASSLKNEDNKNVLLIGARNMMQEGVPKKSSFGNKFSNFWFWVETGVWLTDSQSGFRLYPIETFKNLTFYTNKFEFEIEVIVKASWNGTVVRNIPIQVHYDSEERVSHFRPFADFTRISILNTWLVFVSLFYIKPRDLYRRLKKKGIKRFLIEDFIRNQDTPKKKALSIALGVFIGLSPFWGFHTIIVLFLAFILRLNKIIAFAFSNISLPPFIPLVLYASSKMGQLVLGTEFSYTLEEVTANFEVMKYLKTYIVGSFSLALLSSVVLGLVGYLILSVTTKRQIALKHD